MVAVVTIILIAIVAPIELWAIRRYDLWYRLRALLMGYRYERPAAVTRPSPLDRVIADTNCSIFEVIEAAEKEASK